MNREGDRRIGVAAWGTILIFLGVIFLLQTLDIIPWNLWRSLWRIWPVLIIIGGIEILMRRFNIWLVSLINLAILSISLWLAWLMW